MPTEKHPGWHRGENLTCQVREQEKDESEAAYRQPLGTIATERKEIQEHDQAAHERHPSAFSLPLLHVSRLEPMILEGEAT